MRALAGQFAAFSLVGVAAAVGHYGLYVVLVLGPHVTPLPASLAGFLLAAAISYALNYRYTFRSSKSHREATVKFLSVATGGFILNGLLMALLTGPWAVNWLLAQLIATGLVMFWSFTGNKLWTFAHPRG